MFFSALSTVLEASASRLPRFLPSAVPGSSRSVSTIHLGNLAPAKGSTKDVSRHIDRAGWLFGVEDYVLGLLR
jgi:hypothetical protein